MGVTIDIKESIVITNDPANRAILGRSVVQSIRAMLFTNTGNATWLGDRVLRSSAYPLSRVSIKANRNTFNLRVGDLFRIEYDQYNIANMVFRINNINEENLESEVLNIDAIEDVDYLASKKISAKSVAGTSSVRLVMVEPLTKVTIMEMPYIVAGNKVLLVPMASRETMNETGYIVYMSSDGGSSYTQIDVVERYNPYGELVGDYLEDTYKIDDETGFVIDFYNSDMDIIESTTRTNLFTGLNTAVLGDEIISFETITPISGTRYRIDNIVRGLFDTERMNHYNGEDFYYIGNNGYTSVANPNVSIGAERVFKFVPFNSKRVGDLSDAEPITLDTSARAKKPYKPSNIKANDKGLNATYTNDIVLTWYGRIRGAGAGIGVLSDVVGAPPTFEGYFKIEVYVGASLKRTVNELEVLTWIYTEAMNISDNGSLADEVTFVIYNCIYEDPYIYCSDDEQITVTKE